MVILKKSLLESCVFDQQVLKWAVFLPVTLDFKVHGPGWASGHLKKSLLESCVFDQQVLFWADFSLCDLGP